MGAMKKENKQSKSFETSRPDREFRIEWFKCLIQQPGVMAGTTNDKEIQQE